MSASFKNILYTLPGFPNGLPEHDLLVEHAIEYFSRARGNQGMVGLSWEGEDKKGEKVLYHDLFITYNYNDGLNRSDKFNIEFKEEEMVISNQPLGKNTGIVHEKAIDQLKARIAKAVEENSTNLATFKGLYTRGSSGEIILNKQKMFGWSLFKGHDFLIDDLRNKSANINNNSIVYNQEYLYINFFYQKIYFIIDHYPCEFFLRRSLPIDIIKRIKNVLKKQLPFDFIGEEKFCRKQITSLDNFLFEETWKKIQNDPVAKIEGLAYTLDLFCSIYPKLYLRLCALYPDKVHIQIIVNLLKKNYAESPKMEYTLNDILKRSDDTVTEKRFPLQRINDVKRIWQYELQEEKKAILSLNLARNGIFSNAYDISSPSTPIEYLLTEFKMIKDSKIFLTQKQRMLRSIDTFILLSIHFDERLEYDFLKQETNVKMRNEKIIEKFLTIINDLKIFPDLLQKEMFSSQQDFIDNLINRLEKYTSGLIPKLI